MIRRFALPFTIVTLLAGPGAIDALAQARPRPAASRPSRAIQIGGYAMAGRIDFSAAESFDAILGGHSGPMFGGGARVGLPLGGLFVDVGAWRFHDQGERVFVTGSQIVPLNIPVEVTVTPLEVSAGWQFRLRRVPKLVPYLAGGFTSFGYRETSRFSGGAEDADERFTGYHAIGGAGYRITRWIGIGGEFAWTTVPDAIGEAGVSALFDETDLGGTSVRLKITIGR
jgi:hypothetical protein